MKLFLQINTFLTDFYKNLENPVNHKTFQVSLGCIYKRTTMHGVE